MSTCLEGVALRTGVQRASECELQSQEAGDKWMCLGDPVIYMVDLSFLLPALSLSRMSLLTLFKEWMSVFCRGWVRGSHHSRLPTGTTCQLVLPCVFPLSPVSVQYRLGWCLASPTAG